MSSPLIALLLLTSCAARTAPPTLALPAAETGRVRIVAARLDTLGDVQPIAVAATSAREGAVVFDPAQVFAHTGDLPLTPDSVRIAPLPPGEAARLAGGATLPGAVRSTAAGAATGGLGGALSGAVSGAITGGVGIGSAIGAAVGALAGAFGAQRTPAPDVQGFQDRALPATTLRSGLSVSGYLYYPAGEYRALEVLLVSGDEVVREAIPVAVEP